MRFILATLIVVIGFSVRSTAQNFDAGLIGGLAATQVDGDSYGGYNKAGPIAGVWVGHRINSSFYSRIEFRYIQKGSYAKTSDEGGYYRMRLNYFELPLVVGRRLGNSFNLIAALSFGYLAKAKEVNQYGSISPQDIDRFRKFEFAGKAGIEYNYSEHWAFNAVFSYSILPIRPYKVNVPTRWDRGQYNQVIEAVARYKF